MQNSFGGKFLPEAFYVFIYFIWYEYNFIEASLICLDMGCCPDTTRNAI
jgi:hypothetical protein